MNNDLNDRVLRETEYILKTNKTVREVASEFNVSKSTVHKDLRERLLEIDAELYNEVSNVLQYHMSIRHIRGGEATRRKFMEKNAN